MTEHSNKSWQYETIYYKGPDGRKRKHRKKLYDECPVCGQAKRIKANVCRSCFEKKSSDRDELVHVVEMAIDQYESGGLKPDLVNRMRRAVGRQ